MPCSTSPSPTQAIKLMHNLLRLMVVLLTCARAFSAPLPNVVIIYADDLGWGDLGCYGHPNIRTPNLDRMAAEGMRFTEFYTAAEVCTPSRAALLTGRYPIRSGMANDRFRVLRNNSKGGLPGDEVTVAEVLKTRGYATGMIGKWHLGHLPEHLPPHHGFDAYFGMPYSNDMLPAPDAPKGREKFFEENPAYWQTPLIRGTNIVDAHPDQRQVTRLYTAEAVKFIRDHKRAPFFLYFAHTFPHVPLFASGTFRGHSPAGFYGDVVEELDWSVGQVLDALRRERLSRKTLVIFSSDNGPWLVFNHHGGSAGPLRGGKGSTWEGGMRVPGIAWWPGKIKPGVQREMASTMDILPTVAALAGASLPDRPLDGVDIGPLLFGRGKVQREPFFYYRGTTVYAARIGEWKAHFITRSGYGPDQPDPHDPPLLFQLGEDPGEKWDRAAQHPELIAQFKEAVARHQANVQPALNQLEETVAVP